MTHGCYPEDEKTGLSVEVPYEGKAAGGPRK